MVRCLTMVILLIFLGGGVLAYRVLSAPPSPSPALKAAATAGPSATSAPQQGASSFDQKVGAFEKAAASGGKKPVELVLTEQEIASKVQQMLASRGSGELQSVAVQLQEGGALISGNASLGGMTIPVQAGAQLSASGGMLGVNVTSVKTGNLDLPQALRDQLIQGIQRAVGLNDIQKIDVGIDVQSVQVTPSQVRIAGMTR